MSDTPADYFDHPYVDVDEWRDTPVRHRYVHGGFEGNNTRFSIHLPPAEGYEGRFFQYVTPVPESENLCAGMTGEEDRIGFAFASGGYFVETNGGGNLFAGQGDPYRFVAPFEANAAAATFARTIAEEMYGGGRPYGYLFGGSGGGFRTMGAAENTSGVWDGFAPYVIGSPLALPNVFSVRMHAQRVLRDALDDIVDALEPGGSGDPYATLTEEEAAAFREVSAMGFPQRAWFGHRGLGTQAFAVVKMPMTMADPGYFEDFWTVPGYEGADPSSSVHRDRMQHSTTVAGLMSTAELAGLGLPELPHLQAAEQSSAGVDESFKGAAHSRTDVAAIRLTEPARVDTQGADLSITSGAGAGTKLALRLVKGDLAVLDIGNDKAALDALRPGDGVAVDNSMFLAAQTYHRHQVPADRSFTVWDQFRDASGAPAYPQRPMEIGPLMSAGASGRPQTGRFEGRMIVCASLLDREAFPWQASWYADRVREHLGEDHDDRFRLWFTDNAVHGDVSDQGDQPHIVSYIGTLWSALRSLSDWVEKGIEPAPSTAHAVVDGQIVLPDDAAERGGVQPVVTVTADGAQRADVGVGDVVTLHATATVPVGSFVSVDWDLDGDGAFEVSEPVSGGSTLADERQASFDRPGTYVVTVRVTAQREGDPNTPFARISNLARVRLVIG
jgi:hypothetical protein